MAAVFNGLTLGGLYFLVASGFTLIFGLMRALKPRRVEQPLVGGAWMGVSDALYETTEPYRPCSKHDPRDIVEYVMPGHGDICLHDIAVLERPADGPYGAKGPGGMRANPVLPAVANASYNEVGVGPLHDLGPRARRRDGDARRRGKTVAPGVAFRWVDAAGDGARVHAADSRVDCDMAVR